MATIKGKILYFDRPGDLHDSIAPSFKGLPVPSHPHTQSLLDGVSPTALKYGRSLPGPKGKRMY